ncbi:peptide deformylase [Sorangium cellulosum]|uniref:Peptide deformylase n=1 Tax=Sorangium cellulosum TaxID=56 RepID=A0A2L0EV48_SORCE|nr:peptide deformylase [Sorangium cellulosum]AUX43152.1 peptide deformylase [Sorangium cellulosum]
MAIRTILHYPDPRLRQKALPVGDITPEILKLIDDMAETMYAAPGVGLAATQIGELHRVFLVDVAAENEPSNLLVFINPEIVRNEGQQTGPEGCLSFPGISEDIKRAERVRVRARGRDGATFEIEADGLLAVAIQHELDHLDGVLMIDRMGTLKKRIVQRKMQKRGAEAAG